MQSPKNDFINPAQSRCSSGVEQRIRNAWVGGSIPLNGTIFPKTKSRMSHLHTTLTLVFLAATDMAAQAQEFIGRASVIDGDTIEITGQRFRLHGIDAPESGQTCKDADNQVYRCGQRAALYLDELLMGITVHCFEKDRDRYERIVAECFAGAVNANEAMVEAGWAVAYTDYSRDYVEQEETARAQKSGLWAGDFVEPADFRKEPTAEEIAASEGCVIKGNINSEGRKIYHLPGNTTYGRTIIDVSAGERWFCSVSEAEGAGWEPVAPR